MNRKFKTSDFQAWGSLGGKKRAENLTPERRVEIAKQAIAVKLAKKKKECTSPTT
jgi:hypothetical protein